MKKRIVVAAVLGFLATVTMQAQTAPTACKANAWLAMGSKGGGTPQSSCSARCPDGSVLSLNWCAGTCSSRDATCSTGQTGWVSCNGAYSYCPNCQTTTGGYCEDLNGTACSPNGSSRDCTIRDGNSPGYCGCSFGIWTCTL
jgi:hypothetical protein